MCVYFVTARKFVFILVKIQFDFFFTISCFVKFGFFKTGFIVLVTELLL